MKKTPGFGVKLDTCLIIYTVGNELVTLTGELIRYTVDHSS